MAKTQNKHSSGRPGLSVVLRKDGVEKKFESMREAADFLHTSYARLWYALTNKVKGWEVAKEEADR